MSKEQIDDGGPAFTLQGIEGVAPPCYGMSLRDYFAGQALQGIISVELLAAGSSASVFATGAYEMADAMIEARKL